jgi:hypothetical protein
MIRQPQWKGTKAKRLKACIVPAPEAHNGLRSPTRRESPMKK